VTVLPRPSSLPVGAVVDARGESVASAFFGDREDAGAASVERAACDEGTLEAQYKELAPRIQRFQRDLLGDATLAADATQETFIRAFRRVGELPPGTRLVPWVFGIARHVSLELRRARGRFRRVVVDSPAPTQAQVADRAARTPEAELLDREALVVVERALERLSEDRRAALLLRLDHGLAYEDIAETMGWSLSKAKVEIFRAREVLRGAMDEYRGGVP
jgi:RNA polymerase sigma-70 factor (ECF subfamily)